MSLSKDKIKFFIIIKENSERIKNKNFRTLNKMPLYMNLVNQLIKENLYIDTDSDKIFNHINKLNKKNIVCYKRDKKYIELEKSKKFKISPVYLLIQNFLDNYCNDNDIIVTTHVTSPFIKKNTIYNAIEYLRKGYDSVSAATLHYEFGLLKNKKKYSRINFNEKIVNKTQDLNPVILLNGAFFIFTKKIFLKYKSRYSKKHYYYEIKYPESIDINYHEDLLMARDHAKKN